MTYSKTLLAAAGLALVSLPALAADNIMISDPYARAASPSAKAGAAFMEIMNHTDKDDRLIAVKGDVAERIELHTHIQDGDVMRMTEVEGGIEVPANGSVMLERGGYHVMFMGLTRSLNQGESVDLILTFENAGDVTLTLPVDNERQADHGAHQHQGHKHGD